MFGCTLLYVHSSIAIILMGKSELVALLNLSSWCLVMVERLFLAVPRGCLRLVIVVFPDHTHLIFFIKETYYSWKIHPTTICCLLSIEGPSKMLLKSVQLCGQDLWNNVVTDGQTEDY